MSPPAGPGPFGGLGRPAALQRLRISCRWAEGGGARQGAPRLLPRPAPPAPIRGKPHRLAGASLRWSGMTAASCQRWIFWGEAESAVRLRRLTVRAAPEKPVIASSMWSAASSVGQSAWASRARGGSSPGRTGPPRRVARPRTGDAQAGDRVRVLPILASTTRRRQRIAPPRRRAFEQRGQPPFEYAIGTTADRGPVVGRRTSSRAVVGDRRQACKSLFR
jgi:hypothetical protein